MIDPAAGPFLFDTSAEGWLARNASPDVVRWLYAYLGLHQFSVSAVTVTERIRGYSMLWRRSAPGARGRIEVARVAYLSQLGNVLPVDSAGAVVAGETIPLVPEAPPLPPGSHPLAASRQEPLARWRFDGFIAATALVAGMPLVHNNASDFEAIRSAIERFPERFPGLGRCRVRAWASLGGWNDSNSPYPAILPPRRLSHRSPYRRHLISPSTTVAIGPPWNVLPSKGEFLLREAD